MTGQYRFTIHLSLFTVYLFCCFEFVRLVEVVGVQLLVAEVAAGFTVVLLVDSQNLGVLVALADGLASVLAVDGFHTLADDVAVAVVIGLAGAADAASWTGHNLDEVVTVGVALAHLLHHLAGIAEAVDDSNLQRETVEINGGFLDAVETTGLLEVNLRQLFAGVDFVGGTESSLHNTTGGTEDDGSTGRLTERAVEVLFRHIVEVEVALANHMSQLAGAQCVVDIAVAVHCQFLTCTLALLGQARHNGNNDKILAFHTQFRSQVVLGNGAEHTLGRLGGRGVLEQVGEVLLVEGDPGGAAAGEHRQFHLFAGEGFLEAAEQLGAFLHNGKVGAPVGVVYLVETKATQSGGHFAGYDFTRLHTELFAEGNADGGSGLDNDLLGRVGDGSHNLGDVVDKGEGSDGANLDALAAVHAAAVAKVLLESGSNDSLEATVDTAQGTGGHKLVAHRLAAAAHNALVHIAVHAEGAVLAVVRLLALEGDFLDAEAFGEALQLAVAVLLALQAVVRVVAEEQLDDGLAGVDDACAVGQYFHTLHNVGGAGGSQVAAAFNLDHADAASAGFVFKIHPVQLKVAKSGDVDTVHTGSLKNSGAFGNLNRFVIYCEINHFSFILLICW